MATYSHRTTMARSWPRLSARSLRHRRNILPLSYWYRKHVGRIIIRRSPVRSRPPLPTKTSIYESNPLDPGSGGISSRISNQINGSARDLYGLLFHSGCLVHRHALIVGSLLKRERGVPLHCPGSLNVALAVERGQLGLG